MWHIDQQWHVVYVGSMMGLVVCQLEVCMCASFLQVCSNYKSLQSLNSQISQGNSLEVIIDKDHQPGPLGQQ